MIEAVGICKSYGAIEVLTGVSLKVGGGEGLAVVGRSGSGKTTLLKILGTLAKQDKGIVMIDGVNVAEVRGEVLSRIRRDIGFSFQQPLLLPYLTALENVVLPLRNGARRDEAIDTLKRLGLSDRLHHKPSRLSEGEKKRADLARAIVKRPRILIADEPFSNLDADSALRVSELLRGFVSRGGPLVIALTREPELSFINRVVRLG